MTLHPAAESDVRPAAGALPTKRHHDMTDLTPAESTLIDILRNAALPAVTISITRTEDGAVVVMAIPGDGVNIGAGPTFEAAFFDLCGRELPADSLLGVPPSPSQH